MDALSLSSANEIWSKIHTIIKPYIPCLLVFLSGLGFSIQNLFTKLLAINGYTNSFGCVLSRGIFQFVICSCLVYIDSDRKLGKGPKLFGDTPYVTLILFLRSVLGFGGIGFGLLSTEYLSLGDSSTLTMMSPIFAAILGVVMLGEPWRIPEFIGAILAIIGAILVSRPSFIFGGDAIDVYGVIIALLAAISAALAFIFIRILGTTAKMPFAHVCVSQSISQILLSFPAAYFAHQTWEFNIGWYNFMLIAGLGFVGVFSQIAMTIGMQREKSAAASAMRMSDIFFSFIFQFLFTSDEASWLSIIGASLVMSSVIVIIIFKQNDSTANSVEKEMNDVDDTEMITTDIDEECEIELYDMNKTTNTKTNITNDDRNKSIVYIDMNKARKFSHRSSAMLQDWSKSIRNNIQSLFKDKAEYKIVDQESNHG